MGQKSMYIFLAKFYVRVFFLLRSSFFFTFSYSFCLNWKLPLISQVLAGNIAQWFEKKNEFFLSPQLCYHIIYREEEERGKEAACYISIAKPSSRMCLCARWSCYRCSEVCCNCSNLLAMLKDIMGRMSYLGFCSRWCCKSGLQDFEKERQKIDRVRGSLLLHKIKNYSSC